MFFIYLLAFFGFCLVLYLALSIYLAIRGKGIRIKTDYDTWIKQFDSAYDSKSNFAISTTLSGIKHNDCESVIKRFLKKGKLNPGDPLLLIPDPKNKFDKTATRVCTADGWMIGWLPDQEWNERIFDDLTNGKKWEATVNKILKPSAEFNNYNVLIDLWEFSKK